MKAKEINASGTILLNAIGIIVLVFGIVAGGAMIIQGLNSTADVPIEFITGFVVLFGSIFFYAFAVNIVNINRNLEKLIYYKENEEFEKTQK